jgi:hypothetical protein
MLYPLSYAHSGIVRQPRIGVRVSRADPNIHIHGGGVADGNRTHVSGTTIQRSHR